MDAISLHSLEFKSRSADTHVIVKCRLHSRRKRITFAASALSFALLKNKLEQSFSLAGSLYSVKYRDDENEVTDICSDDDLSEAIEYFSEGSDNSSSSSSVISFASDGTPKIMLNLFIEMEYDGPSLSETMSLRSAHESMRIGSQVSLPYYVKSDCDGLSFVDNTRLYKKPLEISLFTPHHISLICGLVAGIQAPMLYSVLTSSSDYSLGMRLIHTLFAWSALFHIFGAILALCSVTPTMHERHVSFELPHHSHHHDGRLARIARTILHRAGHLATNSAFIFTAIGTACLLSGVLSLLWSAHPLTLHLISMRSLLMISMWIFLGCLVYNRIEPRRH